MKFEPIDYEMIIALNIKRVFFIIDNTEEGITFEQLKLCKNNDELSYYYWNSNMEEWDEGYYDIDTTKQYYILTKD